MSNEDDFTNDGSGTSESWHESTAPHLPFADGAGTHGNGAARLGAAGLAGGVFAATIEATLINHYQTPNGFGFAAEDALNLNDRLSGRHVVAAGRDCSLNGADRIVDGVAYQTKYCANARASVRSLFDKTTGLYRYEGMTAEVPPEQYELAVRLMERRIEHGQVPGVTDPAEARNLVKAGSITREQAVNIARAGTIDGLTYDVKLNAINATFTCSLTFAVSFAQRKWRGESTTDALEGATLDGLAAGIFSLATSVGTAQLMRTSASRLLRVGTHDAVKLVCQSDAGRRVVQALAKASLGKAVYGGAAISHVAKIARSNVLANGIAMTVMTVPDVYRATVHQDVSWAQVGKNVVVNGAGVVGGSAGWWGGATAGSLVGTAFGPVGTTVGFFAGGILGAFGVGTGSSWAANKLMSYAVKDDSVEMIERMPEWLMPLLHDYMLSEAEVGELLVTVRKRCTPEFLRKLYGAPDDAARLVYVEFYPTCRRIVRKRPHVQLPCSD